MGQLRKFKSEVVRNRPGRRGGVDGLRRYRWKRRQARQLRAKKIQFK